MKKQQTEQQETLKKQFQTLLDEGVIERIQQMQKMSPEEFGNFLDQAIDQELPDN